MSVTATTSDLNPIHTIAEAIRALPPSQDPTPARYVTITYADGRFAVQERAPTTQPYHDVDVAEQIQRMVPILFQQIAIRDLPAQEAALAQLQLDGGIIHSTTQGLFSCVGDLLERIAVVQCSVQHLQLLGAHLPEVRKWLLCPEMPPDLAYMRRHSFSPGQLRVLCEQLFMPYIIHNHLEVVQWLLDQGAGADVYIGPHAQRITLLHAILLEHGATREMAACILQHPTLTPLYSDERNELTPLAMACMNDYRYLDLLPHPKAADFRSLMADSAHCRPLNEMLTHVYASFDRLFAKAALPYTADHVFTASDNGLALIGSRAGAVEVAALTGRLHEVLPIYMNNSYALRESFLGRLASVWAAYPDIEISVHSASSAPEGYWQRFPNSLKLFMLFLRHVSAYGGLVRLEYPRYGALRAIPCATAPTLEQQRKSHGALMRFISGLLGYAQSYSPLDSMAAVDQLLVCCVLARLVLAHHQANPSLSALEWQTLLHFHPVLHEHFRRNLYLPLANMIAEDPTLRTFWETVFPITQLGGIHAPWGLIQYQLGWDGATANAMRGETGMAGPPDPFHTIMSTFEPRVQTAIAAYVRHQHELDVTLLPQLFIAADLLQSPHLRDAVVQHCIQDICYGEPGLTAQSFCQTILPILIANNSMSHPTDLAELVSTCRLLVPPTWVAEATREPQDEERLTALAVVVDQFGIDTDDIDHISHSEMPS